MSEQEFVNAEELQAWLKSKKVPPCEAAEAPTLFGKGFDSPATLEGISSEDLEQSGLAIPLAQELSNKLKEQQQDDNSDKERTNMSDEKFKSAEALKTWLIDRDVDNVKAAAACIWLFAQGYNRPSTLIGIQFEDFDHQKVSKPVARHISNKLKEQQQDGEARARKRKSEERANKRDEDDYMYVSASMVDEKIASVVDEKIARAIKAARMARPGTRTNAEFYQDLERENRMEKVGRSFQFPESTKVWENSWYTDEAPTFPGEGASEYGDDGTQAFFDALMNDILDVIERNKGKLPVRMKKTSDETRFVKIITSLQAPKSLPVVGKHNTPSFQKFDGYLSQRDRTGPLSITFATELKPALPRSRGFSGDQLGQILDMATQLMVYEQTNRPFMFTSITDGYRWQFFKIIRAGTSFKYQQSQVYTGLAGCRLFLGFMCAKLNDLGTTHPEIVVDGLRQIRLDSVLGCGSSAVVYDAHIQYEEDGSRERALVKVFEKYRLKSRRSEVTALLKLAENDVKCVPRLVCDGLGESHYKNREPLQNALVVKPVGSPVLPVADGKSVNGKHLSQLILVLQQAHAAGLQHRDVKPDNVYLVNDDIILNDWGSSCPLNSKGHWEGTPGFCDPPDFEAGGEVRDLRSAVRTAWSLTRNQFPTEEMSFWDFLESGNESMWKEAWELAQRSKYKELAALLSKVY